ncbi:MAG: hypothetical protein V1843_02855 [bacterium]
MRKPTLIFLIIIIFLTFMLRSDTGTRVYVEDWQVDFTNIGNIKIGTPVYYNNEKIGTVLRISSNEANIRLFIRTLSISSLPNKLGFKIEGEPIPYIVMIEPLPATPANAPTDEFQKNTEDTLATLKKLEKLLSEAEKAKIIDKTGKFADITSTLASIESSSAELADLKGALEELKIKNNEILELQKAMENTKRNIEDLKVKLNPQ